MRELGSPLSVTYIFTGQGAQYSGMGRSLYNDFSAFRESIDRCGEHLASAKHPPSWSLRGMLYRAF